MALSPKLEWKAILNDSPPRRRSSVDASCSPVMRFRATAHAIGPPGSSKTDFSYHGGTTLTAAGLQKKQMEAFRLASAASSPNSTGGAKQCLVVDLNALNPATHQHDVIPQSLPVRRLLPQAVQRYRLQGGGSSGSSATPLQIYLRADASLDEAPWQPKSTKVAPPHNWQREMSVEQAGLLHDIPSQYLEVLPDVVSTGSSKTSGAAAASRSSSSSPSKKAGNKKRLDALLVKTRTENVSEDFSGIPKAGPNDWNALHDEEGQNVAEFVERVVSRRSRPVARSGNNKPVQRAKIFLLPCGTGSSFTVAPHKNQAMSSASAPASAGANSTVSRASKQSGFAGPFGGFVQKTTSASVSPSKTAARFRSASRSSTSSPDAKLRMRATAASSSGAGSQTQQHSEQETSSTRSSSIPASSQARGRNTNTRNRAGTLPGEDNLEYDAKAFLEQLRQYCEAFFTNATVSLLPYQRFTDVQTRLTGGNTMNSPTVKQLHAGELLKKHLIPLKKRNGFSTSTGDTNADDDSSCAPYAVMAITYEDLYPCEDWPFVSGLSDTLQRVGVCSIARYVLYPDDMPLLGGYCYLKLLKRTFRLITHELCHCFQMKHCVYFSCLMNGSKNFHEAEQKFFDLCPVCLTKLYFMLEMDVQERYRKLHHCVGSCKRKACSSSTLGSFTCSSSAAISTGAYETASAAANTTTSAAAKRATGCSADVVFECDAPAAALGIVGDGSDYGGTLGRSALCPSEVNATNRVLASWTAWWERRLAMF
ncbi:unnamed protein product [Amoebophrya sp. A120]|nr:unnamed protein product [Amoebophrya sp. A120]|eukprot:GSA120T00021435001.1